MNDPMANFNHPEDLEKLYRENPIDFEKQFFKSYPSLKGNLLAEAWKYRLSNTSTTFNWGLKRHWKILVILLLIGGFYTKLPFLIGLEPDQFYQANLGFILICFPGLYYLFTKPTNFYYRLLVVAIYLFCIGFINFVPFSGASDTFNLSALHLPFLMLAFLGIIQLNKKIFIMEERIKFLKFLADFIIIGGLLSLALLLLSGITIGLFQTIGRDIGELYAENILPWLGPAIPLIGVFILSNNPNLINQISPLIAKIFTPLVVIMLILFLITYSLGPQNAFQDREALILFNILLIGVLALIFFSLISYSREQLQNYTKGMLLLLSILTLIINSLALSAIIYRLGAFGVTPNRMAVLGSNLIILIHIGITTFHLIQGLKNRIELYKLPIKLVPYLPVYVIWLLIVVFIFPFIFSFS